MIYPPDFEQRMIDDEQAAIDWIIGWLSDQSPDVWMWFALRANPDTCYPILTWMIEQPHCDRAVVATIFWHCEPYSLAEIELAASRSSDLGDYDEAAALILLVWRDPPPSDSGFIAQMEPYRTRYQEFIAAHAKGADPLDIPSWLYGAFGDRPADPAPAELPEHNAGLRAAMFAMGMWSGEAPPSAERQVASMASDVVAPMRSNVNSVAEMLANETPDDRKMRFTVGLALMTGSITALYWLLG